MVFKKAFTTPLKHHPYPSHTTIIIIHHLPFAKAWL